MITLAEDEDNDLTTFKHAWGDILYNKIVFGDKIYSNSNYFCPRKKAAQQIEMLTPIKAVKK